MRSRSIPLWSPVLGLSVTILIHAGAVAGASAEDVEVFGPLTDYPTPFELEDAPRLKAGTPTFEEEVVELVNQERWDNGQLPPLKHNGLLDAASETHSSSMAVRNFFAHCDLDTGSGPGNRVTAAGYPWVSLGENIAAGYSTPAAVMAGWMGSPGHRDNILSTSRYEIGVGHVLDSTDTGNVRQDQNGDCTTDLNGSGPYYRYWTQNFGRRSNVYPVVINREAFMTTDRNVSLYLYGTGWAIDMRIRNENGTWSTWQPFGADGGWTLSSGSGVKTVTVEIRNGVMSVLTQSDTIMLDQGDRVFEDGFESGDVTMWSN
jgi:uncharacterized protein YkwD